MIQLKVFMLAGLWLPGPELKAAAGIAGNVNSTLLNNGHLYYIMDN